MEEKIICDHIKEIHELKQPVDLVCDECVKTGSHRGCYEDDLLWIIDSL